MKLLHHTVRPATHRKLLLGACALLVLAGGVGEVSAQLPPGPPAPIFADDFNRGGWWDTPSGWSAFNWDRDDSDYGDWEPYRSPPDPPITCALDRWMPTAIREDDSDQAGLPGGGDGQHLLVVTETLAGRSILNSEKTNVRIEFDFRPSEWLGSRPGAAWAVSDTDSNGMVDDAYIFYFSEIPDPIDTPAMKARWHLVKRVAGADIPVIDGFVDATSDPTWIQYFTVARGGCYRLRVDYFCGYVRVQVMQFQCTTSSTCTIDSEWLTVVEWIDDFSSWGPTLAPGGIGLFSGSDDISEPDTYFDNFEYLSWGESCNTDVCTEWSAWDEVNREPLVFKHLYEGGLIDYSAGRNVPQRQIDVATTSPDPLDLATYCDGWKLLVDLPDPIISSDIDKVRHYLEDTSTSVNFVNDGFGNFNWSAVIDEDPASGTFNPVPLVADGSTPIGASLMDAYEWYVDQLEPGGRWENDPLAECRKWYVVLITDGADTCADPGTFACDPNQAAEKFANPSAAGVDPAKIFTIGFSESLAAAPPQLTCISDITGGQYFGARNASELKDALYNVITQLNTDDERSFIPFKVSPPPSFKGGPAEQQDFLAVYPYFLPQGEMSVWSGNLYGFKLTDAQPTIPANADCEVDASQLIVEEVSGNVWDAAARLADQLAAGTPVRPTMMGRLNAGSWQRHDLTEVAGDAALRLYLQNVMRVPGGITDLETQEVVNFLRYIWMDNDAAATPDPRAEARPSGTPVLGDVYHSQPVIVSPPNRSMFYFDYGFGNAHDYPSFLAKHAKRRRVVFAGANDGLLHAFDGGIWDRDRASSSETYNEQHDLGDGSELFTYLPHAVMPRLYALTYGKTQQYMVDGLIAVSDVFIDYDGDSDREWRTVALATMRRGGRGIVALDITQPDPVGSSPDFIPTVSRFPGCIDGTTSGCDGEYPKVLWEFWDDSDADSNCPGGLSGIQCAPYWDLGWTWSKPAIARIAVHNGSDPSAPDDVFVAFFGGGWDKDQADQTGNFLYGVDIETGNILYKHNIGVAVPSSPTALDSDIDGFHDRIYFADSDGGVFRLEFPDPTDSAATGADAGTLTRIFDFRSTFADGGFPDRQQFFTRPVTVPALFTGSDYTWALALGSGDRANVSVIDNVNNPIDHFFFLLDNGDTTTRGQSNLVAVNYDELDGDFDCESSALDPANGNFGWYLSLRPNEKVMFEASVINGHVLFPTFDPTPNVVATHNVPDECVPSGGGTPTPTPTPGALDGDGEEVICKAAGIGRAYDLWFECGLGDYGENNDVYTGIEDYTIGGTTYVTFSESGFTEGETEEFPNVTGHVVTNWRQE